MENNEMVVGSEAATTTPVPETPKKTRGKYATKDVTEYPYVVFKFTDGTSVTWNVETDMTDEDRKQATLHGASQKGGDSYASATNLIEAKAALDKTIAAVKTNGWKARIEGATEEPAELLAQAIVLALTKDGIGPDLGTTLEKVRAADRKQRNAWKSIGAVAGHLADLRGKGAEVNLAADFGM